MTNLPKKEDIRQMSIDYRKAKGISLNELANMIDGVSSGTLSKIDNLKWDGISDSIWKRIWNKVSEIVTPTLFQTNDFVACMEACKSAQKNHHMIGVIADTGMGKTTALNTYSLQKNVFYVVYDMTMRPKHFFASLLKAMGISFEGSIHEMVNKIADEINTISSPLIIIDEAGKLTNTMILYLHVLRDKTIKNCGILLGGMPYFKMNLVKGSNKQKVGYAEFLRRVNVWHELEGLSRSEIKYICESNGIIDVEFLKDVQNKKRFGDLQNAITFYIIQQSEV